MHIVGTGVYGWYGESLHGLAFDEPMRDRKWKRSESESELAREANEKERVCVYGAALIAWFYPIPMVFLYNYANNE